ncbi:MAG: ABC transporter ATP-binding protein [Nannocystales bacterium]
MNAPTPKTPVLLRAHELCVDYPAGRGRTLRALHRVSLTLRRGRALALVGESGSGKSTVSKVIARLVHPASGSLELDGAEVLGRRVEPAYRQRVQMIFQDPFASLNPAHSIEYHLKRPLLRHGKASRQNARAAALELLDRVGLQPADAYIDRRPFELSGGQRQRVAIARALAVEPDVLLADEPTSMLDVSVRIEILNLLRDLKTSHSIGMLVVTHDLASARYLADEIAVMYAGEIVEHGPADEIVGRPQHPYTRLLLGSVAGAPRPDAPLCNPEGHRPDLTSPPTGCCFASLCPRATGACRTGAVPLHERGPQGFVACHRPHPVPDTEEPLAS